VDLQLAMDALVVKPSGSDGQNGHVRRKSFDGVFGRRASVEQLSGHGLVAGSRAHLEKSQAVVQVSLSLLWCLACKSQADAHSFLTAHVAELLAELSDARIPYLRPHNGCQWDSRYAVRIQGRSFQVAGPDSGYGN